MPGELKRLDGLFRVMRGLSAGRQAEPYRVAVSGGLDAAQFKSVIQTAAYAGWPVAVLETARGDISIHSLTPAAPGASPNLYPPSMIVLVVRSNAVEVWLTQRPGEAPVAASERLDDGRSLVEILGEECRKTACNPASLLVSNDAPYRAFESALAALQAVDSSQPLHVHVRPEGRRELRRAIQGPARGDQKLVFPKPTGGVVTVVYPIEFSAE